MNESRAKQLAETLVGSTFEGWSVEKRAGVGKSAIVFKASRGGQTAALKVFDPELIDLYGREIQEERIRRQLSLVGFGHPNLVPIFDGGWSNASGLFYLVMEHLDMSTLDQCLSSLPSERVGPLIAQVASAAQALESRDPALAHRDIKPPNIAVSADYARAVLLDVGVVRPIGKPGGTDSTETARFVGTMRYSPPEFIMRREADTAEGWRAVTFYQLGAVLSDMLNREPLFADKAEPVARLVEAIRSDTPSISATAPRRLGQLARNCLVKDPAQRLALVKWEHFEEVAISVDEFSTDEIERRLRARHARSQATRSPNLEREQEQQLRVTRRTLGKVVETVEDAVSRRCISSDDFPPVEQHLAPTGADSARLLVIFCRSDLHELRAHVHLWLELKVLDASAEVVELMAVAGLRDDISLAPPTGAPAPAPVFRGVFEASSLETCVSQLLLRLLDAAQEASAAGDGSTRPQWLDLSSMLG